MLPEKIIYFGLILHFFGQISYLVSMAKGYAKPNLVSWVIWAVAPFLGSYFQFKAGAGLSVLPVFMAGFGPFLVVIFSIFNKKSYWKLTTFDIYCGILSIMALFCYFFTKNLAISIFFALSSDALAGLPTLVKAWKFPETESSPIYFFALISNILGLLIIKEWSFSVSAFGISIALQCVLTIFFIYRKKIFKIA